MSSESHMSEPSILSHPFPPQKYPLPPTYANFSAIFCHRHRYRFYYFPVAPFRYPLPFALLPFGQRKRPHVRHFPSRGNYYFRAKRDIISRAERINISERQRLRFLAAGNLPMGKIAERCVLIFPSEASYYFKSEANCYFKSGARKISCRRQ